MEIKNRDISFIPKLEHMNFRARYNGYRLDLSITLKNINFDMVKSIKSEISHIIEESGIKSYILRLKSKEKSYRFSSENHSEKNSETREVNVRV
ncbi:MAG: hypothetical protein Q9M89_01510 [Persephonella sp.]|nr:hypothetical protein [Persephonella sp.]